MNGPGKILRGLARPVLFVCSVSLAQVRNGLPLQTGEAGSHSLSRRRLRRLRWIGFGGRGQRVEEDASVALALDAGVEQHEHAAVLERADEAAEALFQRDDRAGHLVVEEGVASGGGHRVHACLDDGVGGNGEGQLVDDDATELLALHVHALPEAGGAEENGAGRVAELLQQDGAAVPCPVAAAGRAAPRRGAGAWRASGCGW